MAKGEFGRIADYFAPLANGFPSAYGLQDDAATISMASGRTLVVTTDTIVEGVHYLGNESPATLARKLLRVSLSDLAAMGAVARAYTLNIALGDSVSDAWVKDFCGGLRQDQSEFGIHLIGGDSVSTNGPLVLTATLFGEIDEARVLRRSGACPGDSIFVSGTLGDGALGLLAARDELAEVDKGDIEFLSNRYRLPQPRIDLGQSLVGISTAAADISDGLLADLRHICGASGVGAEVILGDLPLSSAAKRVLEIRPHLAPLIATGGDDYELVFTVPKSKVNQISAQKLDVQIVCIGTVVEGKGVRALDSVGSEVSFARMGFRHN